MDLVSVIMPAYNAGEFIEETIQSILRQSYSNYEIVIVNDGAKDNTGEIIQRYKDMYPDIINYIDKKINEGTALTLNRAIMEAKGTYICWLSADDLYVDNTIESLVNYLNANTEYDIIFSDYELIDRDSKYLRESFFCKDIEELKEKSKYQPYKGLLATGCIINGCSMVIPKKCYEEVGLFNPKYRYAHDYDLWLRMAAKYKIGFLDKVNIKSRTYPEQISQLGRNEVDALNVLFDFFENKEYSNMLIQKANYSTDINGIFKILNKLLSVYKHRENEFNALHSLGEKFLSNHIKEVEQAIDKTNINMFIKKCELMLNNPIISNCNFFDENVENNYLNNLCKYLNIDGFIINKQAIRFDRFEGTNDIKRLNDGLMRNNSIVICDLDRTACDSILENNIENFRYYLTDNEKSNLKIGISYFMLCDDTFNLIFNDYTKEITDFDIWSCLMESVITENLIN